MRFRISGYRLLLTPLTVPFAFLLTIGVLPLRAEATLTINTGDMHPAGYSAPQAGVTIDLGSSRTIATVALDSLTNGGHDYLMTATGSADLNALTLKRDTWSSAADVLSPNYDGAAMHRGACSKPCVASEGSAGFAAHSRVPASTPAPTSMLLFGSSLLLIGGILRRQLRRAQCDGVRRPNGFWPAERGRPSTVSVSSGEPH